MPAFHKTAGLVGAALPLAYHLVEIGGVHIEEVAEDAVDGVVVESLYHAADHL